MLSPEVQRHTVMAAAKSTTVPEGVRNHGEMSLLQCFNYLSLCGVHDYRVWIDAETVHAYPL